MIKATLISLSLILFFSFLNVSAQSCTISSYSFKDGEKLNYLVQYNWGLIWVDAGSATFTVRSEKISTLPVYHFQGVGSTFPKYDWFYKVDDKFDSYADTLELKPFRYKRNTSEGNNKVYNDTYFNIRNHTSYYTSIEKGNKVVRDTVKVDLCTKDVLTMIYYARCIDFSNYKTGDKIPVSLFLDGKVYQLYIRYAGKEKKTTAIGTFDCIKFRPLLIAGTIFKEGDEMNVWVTDDKNRIPIYIETPIVVGSVKVMLTSAENTRIPFISAK